MNTVVTKVTFLTISSNLDHRDIVTWTVTCDIEL